MNERNEPTVDQGEECPTCHEDRIDWLVWDEISETVTCSTCGTTYDPNLSMGH